VLETADVRRANAIQSHLSLCSSSARLAYDQALVRLMRVEPTSIEWTEVAAEVAKAREVVLEYTCNEEKQQKRHQEELAKAQVQEATKAEPTKVEPEPTKVKSIAQQKAVDNARIAMANKGKTAKEKAEALDVPVATVKKVEKAKAASQGMTSKDLRKAASELKIDVTKVNFKKKSERSALEATIKAVVANSKSNQWQGLSASRQQQLNKLAN
jgi:hypothetical protein